MRSTLPTAMCTPTYPPQEAVSRRNRSERPWRHHLLMMAMCLPMLVIVGALVITGVAGAGAIGYAVLCTAMMAAMMMLMRGDRH